MYDNYNNNEGFNNNNPKPLFSNEFNNMSSNSFNSLSNENQNGINGDFTNINSFNNFESSKDIPPELEPIKNLSDSSKVEAPTLDVLNPMNIMPENLNGNDFSNMDKLDAYDNGINYINNDINNNQINNMYSNQMLNETNNDYNSNNLSLDNNTKYSQFNNMNVNSSQNNNYESINKELYSNDYTNELENKDIINNKDYLNVNATHPNNINEVNFTQTISDYANNQNLDSNLSYQMNNIENNLEISNLTHDSSIEEKVTDENKNDNLIKSNIINEEESKNDYEIIQKNIESLPKDEMLNLGINNSYDDIDTLDIMDVEEEGTQEETKKEEEKTLIIDNINEIKKLLNNLKEKGLDLELEEFDFENMYQLIIKINK